jgi:acetyltransferase
LNLKRGLDPQKCERLVQLRDGRTVLLRTIKPEDEPLWHEMFQNFSNESVHNRFFYMIRDTPHAVRARYCDIDYSREIAIVAELKEERKRILGVVRLTINADQNTGEVAFIVADPWQGLGLGSQMVDYMIEICKDIGLETVYALVLPDNYCAIRFLKKREFTVRYEDDVAKATLKLREDEKNS